ncbi:MAG: proline--tRNA ligase [Candidatus Woykebacteria bacterium RBG_19FT_COMBO_43_10]|uniref:Proline--tRNA ligase n=1 Tax=Candidatus Woykebacteria bacterium RBG_19FT_COMBO_43_10 TaxID=1802598 RepID=A0A1G1WJ01_9BACT|nr:MAG: proline--tRNA ligase [Candidatus Woykebacteria bacterium RBG_19FT_COMBO_43_10]
MRYSKLFGKTLRAAPREAEAISHKLLARAGFIDQLAAGIYTFLPLGWKVHSRIEDIIREEMDSIGGQEFSMPVLHPKALWQETGRWETIDPPLFVTRDRHDKEYALGPTHEEVITDLARRYVKSYKDLPFSAYQIQDKFRNELRATGGLLRTREFFMKDLYSFHTDAADFKRFFKDAIGSYTKIFASCGLKILVSQASSGSIGGDVTYEFQVPSEVGEDLVFFCKKCGYAINREISQEKKISNKCPECGGILNQTQAIEAGQVFSLGTKYSKGMGATFVDRDGKEKPIIMGCYGIGVGRLMATIVEIFHDSQGIVWPENVAPYRIHLVAIGNSPVVAKKADEIYNQLIKKGEEVLYDDREESPGVKLADADLIGIPERWLISEKTLKEEAIEVKKRGEESTRLVSISNL